MLNCLKENLIKKKRLSPTCSDQVKTIMEQQVLHYEQDPVLVKWCSKDIDQLCANEEENRSYGGVEECLKVKFEELQSAECRRHIAFIITAVQVDIQTDPLLHRACAIDLMAHCKQVPAGEGRRKY